MERKIAIGNGRSLKSAAAAVTVAITFAVAGCGSVERLPAVLYAQQEQTKILGIEDARFYVSDTKRIQAAALKAYERRNKARSSAAAQTFLAVSGGGDDGAFGAGLLVGWSDRGDRPSFDVVTGVSTGSLSAPFAFLGKEYDAELREVYTNISAADVFQKRPPLISAIANDALTDNAPLRNVIARYFDAKMMQRVAEEYRKGRLLFILTTNLDQGRPVVWNIGAIAESADPKARELIIDVLLASTSIPAFFPPVMMDVTVDGQRHQEMHVDGGTIAQSFLYPPSFSFKQIAAQLKISAEKLKASRKRVAYVIRNGRLLRPEENVKPQTISIAKQAISTMIASSGVNDTYRMYLIARRDGVDFNLAAIDDDFVVPYKGPFDKDYMNTLFDYGYQKGRAGYRWQKTPPGYAQ